jgi:hypothetical protein
VVASRRRSAGLDPIVREPVVLGGDVASWDVCPHGDLHAAHQSLVGAGERVDAVVVAAVWEGGDFVEKLGCVALDDERVQPLRGAVDGGREPAGPAPTISRSTSDDD